MAAFFVRYSTEYTILRNFDRQEGRAVVYFIFNHSRISYSKPFENMEMLKYIFNIFCQGNY